MSLSGVANSDPALALAALASLRIGGAQLAANVANAITDCVIDLSTTQASTLTVTIEDPFRVLLRSSLFASTVTASIEGHDFVLVQVSKTGNSMVATFEDSAINALRHRTGQRVVAPNTMTRVAFAALLVAEVPGLKLVGWPSAQIAVESLSRGTAATPDEDSWTCLTRLASEIGWECYAVDNTIYFGPDSWLLQSPPIASVAEITPGVDSIDFDWDVGKPVALATIQSYAPAWVVPPGSIVTLAKMGVASGNWIVTDVSRSIFYTPTTISVQSPQPSLTEAEVGTSTSLTSTTSASATSAAVSASLASGTQTSGGTTAAQTAVQYALAQVGKPYLWGGENPALGFDCSGLVQASYTAAGIALPRVAQDQYNAGPALGASAPLLPGDLIFFGSGPTNVTHVGIYLGNGQMVDAPHTGAFVRVEPVPTTVGASWGADLVVGFTRPAP